MSLRERRGKGALSLPIPPAPSPSEGMSDILSTDISLKDLTILEPIGRGAFSTVYKVKKNSSGKIYAMKKIKYIDTPQQLKNVVNEIYYMNRLRHKNVLQLYNAFYDEGSINVIMPLINGLTFSEALSVSHNLPEPILGRLTYLSVQGLVYLKKQGVIHRDLKPSNILLSTDGSVMIADFGMARQLRASSEKAQSYTGTMSYMAPERLRNESYSFKSDVWSLGLIIYQAALGRFPIKGDPLKFSDWDILTFGEGITIELPKAYSEGIYDFLIHCLSPSPENRSDIVELSNHQWLLQFASNDCDKPLKDWINSSFTKYSEHKHKNLPTLNDVT